MRVREWFNGLIAECKPSDSAYSIWIEPVWWAVVCVALAMHGAQSAPAVHAGVWFTTSDYDWLECQPGCPAGMPSWDARPGGRFGPDHPWAFLACGVASAFRSMWPTSSGSYRTAVLHVSPARRAGLSARAAVSWPYLWLRLADSQRLGCMPIRRMRTAFGRPASRGAQPVAADGGIDNRYLPDRRILQRASPVVRICRLGQTAGQPWPDQGRVQLQSPGGPACRTCRACPDAGRVCTCVWLQLWMVFVTIPRHHEAQTHLAAVQVKTTLTLDPA